MWYSCVCPRASASSRTRWCCISCFFHIPPDLVVKAQAFDIIDHIPSLIRGRTSPEHHVVQRNCALRRSHSLRANGLPLNPMESGLCRNAPGRAHTSCVDTAGDGLAALVRLVWLGLCTHRCGRDHPLLLCLSSGDRSRRRRQYSGATSTSDNWSDHGRPALEQYSATNTTDRAEMSPGSNVVVIAYSGGAGYR